MMEQLELAKQRGAQAGISVNEVKRKAKSRTGWSSRRRRLQQKGCAQTRTGAISGARERHSRRRRRCGCC